MGVFAVPFSVRRRINCSYRVLVTLYFSNCWGNTSTISIDFMKIPRLSRQLCSLFCRSSRFYSYFYLSASSIDFLRSFSVASVNPIFHWQ